jgi:hypothetical protein
VAWWVLARRARRATADLEQAWSWIDRRAPALIAAVALASGAGSVWFATRSASGADASGYLSQAMLLASGRLMWADPLARLPGWPASPGLSVPLGWRPALVAGWQVPTYPPGLPALMAPLHALGGSAAACLVVSLAAGVAVWSTGQVAAKLAGGAAGVMAALLLASAPVFLYQSVQPMGDVPVTAAWMAGWLLLMAPRPRRVWAGIACALAVLIRPNLAPLAAIPLGFLIADRRAASRLAGAGLSAPDLRRALLAFAAPVAAAGALLALLHWYWYGSPLRSGYGTAQELFAWSHAAPNLARYATWLATTSPCLLLAPIGLFFRWRHQAARWLVLFAGGVVAAYLAYFVFADWSYLRFLLPALAVLAIFGGAAAAAVASRLPGAGRAAALVIAALVIVGVGVSEARARGTFRLAGQQRRIADLGRWLRSQLPESAVIVSGEQSGALRYYTRRPILRWEAANPATLAQALAVLERDGHDVWIALDAWEEPLVRETFAALPVGALDWPPAAEAGDAARTRVWRLADRERFRRGGRLTTARLR